MEEMSLLLSSQNQLTSIVFEIASNIVSSINEIDFSPLGFGFNHVTLSMGLAFFPAHGLNRKDLMEHADKNLMKAKESGKNQVVF